MAANMPEKMNLDERIYFHTPGRITIALL